jgi:multiple sugar transport system substrate-binding protein
LVKRFQRENPDVSVTMQIIPWGTYYDKVTLSLAFGGAPDLFVIHASRIPEFAAYDALRPVADLIAGDAKPLTAQDFARAPWEASFYNGKQYALPLDVHPIGLYYNRDLLQKAGYSKPPTNWDEFLEIAKATTADTDKDGATDQWGFVVTNQRMNFLTFAPQFNGGILSPDLKRSAMTEPGALESAKRLHDLIYVHKVAPRPEGVDAWLAFRQGKAAMALEGIYMMTGLQEQKGLNWAGAPVPQFGPTPACWGGTHTLCLPNDTDPRQKRDPNQSKAAWRLTRYLSDNSLAWAEGGQVPARLDIAQSPEFQALPTQAAFARQLPYVQYEPLTPRASSVWPFADPAIEAVLLQLSTPERAFADASRRINQVLERP